LGGNCYQVVAGETIPDAIGAGPEGPQGGGSDEILARGGLEQALDEVPFPSFTHGSDEALLLELPHVVSDALPWKAQCVGYAARRVWLTEVLQNAAPGRFENGSRWFGSIDDG
jgi:hypothetical protein